VLGAERRVTRFSFLNGAQVLRILIECALQIELINIDDAFGTIT
jgi:hypothetical protein